MEFVPNTPAQQREMLDSIGLTMADLFSDVPPDLMAKSFRLPDGLSEQEVR
jgi:glycine cleavage system pyridoxal-binding protein P